MGKVNAVLTTGLEKKNAARGEKKSRKVLMRDHSTKKALLKGQYAFSEKREFSKEVPGSGGCAMEGERRIVVH